MTNTTQNKNSSNNRVMDGNEAAASVAYRCNDVIGIYPITPSSPMAEQCEVWSTQHKTNFRGLVPEIYEMQSEGGAAGLLHGALTAGSLATSFTSSQGLLLMLPNMYKIAGELTPFVLHVAARTVATHALSIFGDHSDVMAARQTGFAMLAGNNVQQAHDFALISQAASLKSRIPFLHFFDGFRTSHELNHVDYLDDATIKAMLDEELIEQHYLRRLTPDSPTLRGSAQNPDTWFQAREAVNPFYNSCADTVIEAMDRFGELTGRHYQPFSYLGAADARSIVVIMGSATRAVEQAVEQLNTQGEKVGVLSVHLYRPFSVEHCIQAIPSSVRHIAVLDRTKEPGAVGEPLFVDLSSAILQAWHRHHNSPLPTVIGGRYGLSGKEFSPQHALAVFEGLRGSRIHHNFTVGIEDDITGLSLPLCGDYQEPVRARVNALFYGLGSDGTVGANKNSIKIVAGQKQWFTQGYFVYDSKKSGGMTTSHLRFDKQPIDAPYLIQQAEYIGVHQFSLLKSKDILVNAAAGATVLFNSPVAPDQLWSQLSRRDQRHVLNRSLKLYSIDASALADRCGIHGRVNGIMQRAFFLLTDLLSSDDALSLQVEALRRSYQSKGAKVVEANLAAIKQADAALLPVTVDNAQLSPPQNSALISNQAPDFVRQVTNQLLQDKGDLLPVSAFPVDGSWPTNTSQWEKRDIAAMVPVWDPEQCTQCNTCSLVCPHAAIRVKVVKRDFDLSDAPASFKTSGYQLRDFKGEHYTLQVSPQDCTGCQLCARMCPGVNPDNSQERALQMVPRSDVPAEQQENFTYFTKLPELKPIDVRRIDARSSQLLEPLLEFSGACSGCGETPYIKLLTQLYGDHMLIANATGCSSIYGGNLPTTPYAQNSEGQGPAWANSLFEDNAEFGLGMRMAQDSARNHALRLLGDIESELPADLYHRIKTLADDNSAKGITEQRGLIEQLKRSIDCNHPLQLHADALVAKSVWIIGGDGWAFDIGFGGLDHVLAGDKNVNIIVLNNQVYANTGGQQSKATPTSAVAKFASEGKQLAGKDLGITTMLHGNAYVATVAMGANMNQTLKAIQEAEAYPGPSLIIAYASCITHGIDMQQGIEQQSKLVESGLWPLYRFDPRRKAKGKAPLQLDSRPAKSDTEAFTTLQRRFTHSDNQADATRLSEQLQMQITQKQTLLGQLAEWK